MIFFLNLITKVNNIIYIIDVQNKTFETLFHENIDAKQFQNF